MPASIGREIGFSGPACVSENGSLQRCEFSDGRLSPAFLHTFEDEEDPSMPVLKPNYQIGYIWDISTQRGLRMKDIGHEPDHSK